MKNMGRRSAVMVAITIVALVVTACGSNGTAGQAQPAPTPSTVTATSTVVATTTARVTTTQPAPTVASPPSASSVVSSTATDSTSPTIVVKGKSFTCDELFPAFTGGCNTEELSSFAKWGSGGETFVQALLVAGYITSNSISYGAEIYWGLTACFYAENSKTKDQYVAGMQTTNGITDEERGALWDFAGVYLCPGTI